MKVKSFKVATTLLLSLIALKTCQIESELQKQTSELQNQTQYQLKNQHQREQQNIVSHRFYKEYQDSVYECSKTLLDVYEKHKKAKIDSSTEIGTKTYWEYLKEHYDTEAYIKQHCESRHKYWLED